MPENLLSLSRSLALSSLVACLVSPQLLAQVAAPVLSPSAHVAPTEFDVTVTCPTAGAVIRYSTTGSDPALIDGTVAHGGTIRVRHSMTLKAKAWLGAQSSPVASGTYTITGAIAAGSEHMLALKFDRNRVWSWE